MLWLLGCGGYLTMYVPPPVAVGDVTEAGDVQVELGPDHASAVVGVIDHLNVRASGHLGWGGDELEDPDDIGFATGEIGPDTWDARLGVGTGTAWTLGKKGQLEARLGGAVDGGIGHIHDYIVYDDESVRLSSDNEHLERTARLSADSRQLAGQVNGCFQWKPVGIGAGVRLTLEWLEDDGDSFGPEQTAWDVVQVEPFWYLRAGWDPVYAVAQVGLSRSFDEGDDTLSEARNLHRTYQSSWATVGIEVRFHAFGDSRGATR